MDLRHLRYFVAVAEAESVSRAATILHVAQPALSRQLKNLEDELGFELLARHAAGVTLTPAGQAFHAGGQRLLAQTGTAVERARRAATGLHGRLEIGVGRIPNSQELVQQAWTSIRTQLPDLAVHIREIEAGPPQWRQLETGELDLAVGVLPPSEVLDLAWEPLFEAPLECALLPQSHPLAERETLKPSDLGKLPLLWVTQETHPDLHAAIASAVRSLRVTAPLEDQYAGMHAVWIAVAAGRGWTLAPSLMTRLAPDGTAAVPLTGLHIQQTMAFIWRPSRSTAALQRVLQVLRAIRDHVEPPAALPDPVAAKGKRSPSTGGIPRGLELRHLRALVAVAQDRSVGRAAERLAISQPALSRQLRDLEREVGTALLERLPRGMRPTAAGESLAADAVQVLALLQGLVADAKRAHRLGRRRCELAAVETALSNPVVHEVLRVCAERYPDIQITAEELPAIPQVGALLEGKIDLGLAYLGASPAYEGRVARLRISEFRLDAALLHREHPLAARSVLRAEDLAEFPFLLVSRSSEPFFHDRVMSVLDRCGVRLGTILASDSLQTTRALAAQGKGWTLAVQRQRPRVGPGSALVTVPLQDVAVPWGLELLWRWDEASPTILAILETAGRIIRNWRESNRV
ncbi:MAG TPA: LysR family transcriptional regulator [Gemmatimonadales bacterium]|nr:LysR family transcriptional regulator [Gemmatimonadales bacterium]